MKSLITLASLALLSACGGGDSPPAPAPVQQVAAPVARMFNSALRPTDLTLNCNTTTYTRVAPIDESVSTEYGYENNSWGAWALYGGTPLTQPWSLCIKADFSDANTVVARMTWDTGNQSSPNTLYPEIVYGFKPQPIKNISTTFPKLTSSTASFDVKWNIEIDKDNSAGQLLIESWLSHSANVVSNHDGKVNAELAIAVDCWGNDGWCQLRGELVTIGGQDYMYEGVQPLSEATVPGSAQFIFFRSVKPQLAGSIDMMQFINFLKSRDAIPNSLYIDSVEFGPEVNFGKGEARVNAFSVSVK